MRRPTLACCLLSLPLLAAAPAAGKKKAPARPSDEVIKAREKAGHRVTGLHSRW